MSGWRKSSACAEGATCVWVDIRPDAVLVTSSARLNTLSFTHDDWRTFITGAKAGEFDIEATP